MLNHPPTDPLSDDIVERLRTDHALQPGPDIDTAIQAADEIERLRESLQIAEEYRVKGLGEIRRKQDEIDRLRVAYAMKLKVTPADIGMVRADLYDEWATHEPEKRPLWRYPDE